MRLLRRALEAGTTTSSHRTTTHGGLDALTRRVLESLPAPRDATLQLKETEMEAEREANLGRGRRRFFDPYVDLFVYRRVTKSPWDEAWRKTPLVLHDGGLIHAFEFPPYLDAQPYDHRETIAKILACHPGPVDSLRVDCSLFPPPEMLAHWMDTLSTRGVREMVMLDVTAPPAEVDAIDFPVSRLRAPSLATLALGFVRVRFTGDIWLSGLESLTLICCVCSGRELSAVIHALRAIKTVKVFCGQFAAGGSGPDGKIEVDSCSLQSLEMVNCRATGMTIRRAPNLRNLVAGVIVGENGPRRLLIELASCDALEEIHDLQMQEHVFFLFAAKCSAKYKRRRVLTLYSVHTLEVSLQMSLADESSRLLKLIAQFPHLQSLMLRRTDDCSQAEDESWYLKLQAPTCFHYSLRYLCIHGYRAGPADVGLVKKILATARSMIHVKLYVDPRLTDPPLDTSVFSGCRKASKSASVYLLPDV